MSERTRNGKTFAQDALGFLFCLVGGFFAVSIVLSMRGQEPKPGLISALTWPVVELDTLLGHAAALLFSAGLATLGTLLFLRSTQINALRPLLALLFGSLGVALLFGGFGSAGEFGAWLPGLVPGFVGRMLALVLGLALAWLGWTLLSSERAPRSSSAELVQRVGLAARHDAAAGVSPAEAALLVSEPRPQPMRPVPRREAVPVRDETIRPYASTPYASTPYPSTREAPASEPRATRLEVSSAPAFEAEEPRSSMPTISVLAPSTPSWEGLPEEAQESEEMAAQHLSEALSEKFVTREEGARETDEEEELDDDPEAELEAGEAEPALAAPRASWEQIGLFDEEEVLEEEAPPAKPARVELTSSFDFGSPEPRQLAHEPEPHEEDPFAVASAPAGVSSAAPDAERDDDVKGKDVKGKDVKGKDVKGKGDEGAGAERDLAARTPPAPTRQSEFLLRPTPAPRPLPAVARDEEGERWSKLVYEAGCAILEQERVAVSMLERRFGIDFDQACRVLDELQQAGLIGPYMGGRTRDILLTREQWLPHAPQAS